MERFSDRDSVHLGYSLQSSFMNYPDSSPKSPCRSSSDVDFNDVFGGPPRRSSIQEVRRSFCESVDLYALGSDEETSSYRRRWSGLSEKPVFGEEVVSRRRHPSDNFFDDIFKVNESLTSSPRKSDRDPFSSSPGSRVLSPVRPLPPRVEPFPCSSLPGQFSLPAKLIKGSDLPTFGSSPRNHHRNSLSRFSSQASLVEESSNDVYFQSSLSHEESLSNEELSSSVKPDEMDKRNDLKMDSNRSEAPTISDRFHFSIYKWASKGVHLALPLGGGNSPKWKDKFKLERSSSASGRIACEAKAKDLTTVTPQDIDCPSFNVSISSDADSSEIELRKKENGSLFHRSTLPGVEQGQNNGEAILPKSEPEITSIQEDGPGNIIIQNSNREAHKSEIKTLHSLLIGTNETTIKIELKESKVKSIKKSAAAFDISEKAKKQDGKGTTLNNIEMDKTNLQCSPTNSRHSLEKNQIRGKVTEFVKIFNQKASNKPKFSEDSHSRSSGWKERGKFKTEGDASVTSTNVNETMHLPEVNKNNTPDASITVDEFLKQLDKQHSETRTNNHNSTDISFGLEGRSASAAIPGDSEAIAGDPDDSFQGNIVIKELPQDEVELSRAGDNTEDIQVINAKIRKWSNGKEGNIRSLLSTLHYILWPKSGWKPVPLVDIIEGSAVKRSYQKALLSLHPDKLQQKGATSPQKYIAEKVFEILQEAWTHFNSLGSV